jgi:uridine kinase
MDSSRKTALERIQELRPTEVVTKLVAIDGQGGAGKSSLAGWLASQLGATVIHVDDFGRPGKSYDEWDWDRLREQVLSPLASNQAGRYQRYDWASDQLGEWIAFEAGGVVIVEGVSVMRQELGHPWDLTIWVDAPYEVRLARGMERDGESMREVWVNEWMPQEDVYVSQQTPRKRADLIVRGH